MLARKNYGASNGDALAVTVVDECNVIPMDIHAHETFMGMPPDDWLADQN